MIPEKTYIPYLLNNGNKICLSDYEINKNPEKALELIRLFEEKGLRYEIEERTNYGIERDIEIRQIDFKELERISNLQLS